LFASSGGLFNKIALLVQSSECRTIAFLDTENHYNLFSKFWAMRYDVINTLATP